MSFLPSSFCCLCCREYDLSKAARKIAAFHATTALELLIQDFDTDKLFGFFIVVSVAALLYFSARKNFSKVKRAFPTALSNREIFFRACLLGW